MTNPFLDKAQLLMSQNRFELAEKEIKQHLASSADDAYAYALLSMCLLEANKVNEALSASERSISLAPESDMALYQYARVLTQSNESKKAEKAIRSAITLNPFNAEYFGLLAIILVSKKKYKEALAFANKGLAIDPSNLTCLNIRTMAQVKTGDGQGAVYTVEGALHHDPENPITHANYGWALLEKGEPNKALVHFKASLRIDPQNQWAKSGLLEGLKARYLVYRLFLRYAFWMEKIPTGAQFAVIIAIWFIYNRFTAFMLGNEQWMPYLIPLWILLIMGILSSWFLPALMNLYLRLNPYGRYALEPNQKRASFLVGIALSVAIIGILGFLVFKMNWMGVMGVFGILMMVPMSNAFELEQKGKKAIMVGLTILLATFGCLAIIGSALTGAFLTSFAVYFIWAFIGYQVLGNVFRV